MKLLYPDTVCVWYPTINGEDLNAVIQYKMKMPRAEAGQKCAVGCGYILRGGVICLCSIIFAYLNIKQNRDAVVIKKNNLSLLAIGLKGDHTQLPGWNFSVSS